jgi:predicted ATPase
MTDELKASLQRSRRANPGVLQSVGKRQQATELAYAGLHQLCAPMLDHAGPLPVPQRDALRIVLGQAAGPPPDRFLVGLAVLGLLSEAAGERPLICVVDDVQWLDRASAQTLGFAARRLAADPVGVVFEARVPEGDLAGLPELVVEGLAEEDARVLLESVLAGPLDARVREQIIADTGGNPLALLELPRGRPRCSSETCLYPAACGRRPRRRAARRPMLRHPGRWMPYSTRSRCC